MTILNQVEITEIRSNEKNIEGSADVFTILEKPSASKFTFHRTASNLVCSKPSEETVLDHFQNFQLNNCPEKTLSV